MQPGLIRVLNWHKVSGEKEVIKSIARSEDAGFDYEEIIFSSLKYLFHKLPFFSYTEVINKGVKMTVLIVGGDRISSIAKYLASNGYDEINHWNARRNSDTRRFIPQNTKLVVILINYLNHGMAKRVRKDAEQLGLPVLFSKNSASELSQVFEVDRHSLH